MKISQVVSVIGAITFLTLVVIGESQIRSSPNWPPPLKHEVGAWTVENPKVLEWATGLNLPATIPILWIWAHSAAFASAFDDHKPIVYFPWFLLVIGLWYFIGIRIEAVIDKQRSVHRIPVLFVQTLLTLELMYVGVGGASGEQSGLPQALFFWIWVLLVFLGWVECLFAKRNRSATG